MLTTHLPAASATRTVFGELQVRSLLDDPALRDSLGIVAPDRVESLRRPANIRRLLEQAAA